MDASNKSSSWGRWLKVKVLVHISKPLVLGWWLNIAGGERVWITFKYEKLPDLCFVCDCLYHMEVDCAMVVASHLLGVEPIRKFEKGVRADGLSATGHRLSLSNYGSEYTNKLNSTSANLVFKKHANSDCSFSSVSGSYGKLDNFASSLQDNLKKGLEGASTANSGSKLNLKKGMFLCFLIFLLVVMHY